VCQFYGLELTDNHITIVLMSGKWEDSTVFRLYDRLVYREREDCCSHMEKELEGQRNLSLCRVWLVHWESKEVYMRKWKASRFVGWKKRESAELLSWLSEIWMTAFSSSGRNDSLTGYSVFEKGSYFCLVVCWAYFCGHLH